ncbi:MAG: penicillin-binding protein 2 [Patescibacteria group bacterium]|nr:penicillin-binding protein 2 [Patescibacteria group bacterium]
MSFRKNWRLNFLLGILLVSLAAVFVRLFQIQILQHGKYQALAETQHGISYTLPAPRGKIYSRDGFPLVSNQPAYLLYAEPTRIDFSKISPGEIARRILEALGIDSCPVINFSSHPGLDSYQRYQACKQYLAERLGYSRYWVPLVREVTAEQKERVEKLGIVGLGFEETPVRYYPEGSLAAHVLGFVGSAADGTPRGYYGVEGFYDGDLRGQEGLVLEERSAMGEPILVGDYMKRPPQEGRDLVLTLDRAVQFMVEELLETGVKEFGAESGTVIILDPTTGGVIAMANYPSFYPAEPAHADAEEDGESSEEEEENDKNKLKSYPELLENDLSNISRNLAISSSYEPGSVIKALTMSAAINEGQVTPQTTFFSQPLKVGDHTIRTWDDKYYGEETMIEVLEHSDNTGAAWLALEKLGKRTLRSYFADFGLGQKTGIDLEGESAGILRSSSEWRPVDLASVSFGQGLSATPLQVTSAFTAFANDGVLMQPYIVSEIREDGKKIKFTPERVRRVISSHTAEVMVGMLTKAAMYGEASFFVLQDWEVAGKTGTAQIPVSGRYDPHKTNATFVGFLPQSKKFVMLVKLEKPSTSIYAAETAVPLWMGIAKELIRYYGIAPDR